MKGRLGIVIVVLILGGFAMEQEAEAYVGFQFGISAHYPARYYYHHGYYPRYYGWYRPYYRPHYWGYYWNPYVYNPYYYPGPAYYPAYGEIRAEVKPKEATVYVDGDYVGFVDQYDGWWQRLRLEPGRHRLVFRAPGFVPYVLDVRVLPGQNQHIKYQMQAGKDYIAENEMRPEGYRQRPYPPREKERYRDVPPEPPREPEPYPSAEPSEHIRFRLAVIPPDATVYIDGNFYGTAESDVGEVQVLLPEGSHRVEVVRPGYRSFSKDVLVTGENNRIEVQLEKK